MEVAVQRALAEPPEKVMVMVPILARRVPLSLLGSRAGFPA